MIELEDVNIDFEIREMVLEDAAAVSELIVELLPYFTVDPSGVGAEKFLTTVTPKAIRERLLDPAYLHRVAVVHGCIVAVIVMRDHTHLYHLVVASGYHRRGLGKALWRHMLEILAAEDVHGPFTVNASRYGVAVYKTMGFQPTSDECQKDGLAFIPMERPVLVDGVSDRGG